MTRLEALTELRDKVAAGENLFGADCMIAPLMNWPAYTEHSIWKASHGSLDAAKALHEAVLPGWQWIIDGENRKLERNAQAQVWKIRKSKRKSHIGRVIASHNPARAWLLAILEALIAQENADD